MIVSGVVQLMQYYYQKGSLYRLRALGQRRSMDVTVGMFHLCYVIILNNNVKVVRCITCINVLMWSS